MIVQALPGQTAQARSERPSEQPCDGIGKVKYMLKSPAIQFTYEPNSFVISEEGPHERSPLRISGTSLWTKEDYLTIKNADGKLGDFPDKLRLTTYANPDGIPVIDWLTTSAGASLDIAVKDLSRQADTTVAGRDAWTFSYRSLFEYEGVAFQDESGQMVLITAYKPPAGSADAENEEYPAARSMMIESMELSTPE